MSKKYTLDLLKDGKVKPVSCRISSGVLLPDLNCTGLAGSVPSNVIFACHEKAANRFFICADDKLYLSGDGKTFSYIFPLAGTAPFFVQETADGVARSAIISGKKGLLRTAEYFMGFELGADLSCGVIHCGRLIGADSADGLVIRWSGGGGVRDWNESINGSGYLKLGPERGQVINIVEYGEKLAAVRQYGLTFLNMYGSPENFSVDITNTDCDKIYKNTAKTAGGKLLFFTQTGLHCYDGSVIRKTEHRFSDDIYEPKYAEEFGGRYYLICKSRSLGRGVLFCYDPADGESFIIDVQADAVCKWDKIYLYNSKGAHCLEGGGSFSLLCGDADFGTSRFKTVKEIYVGSAGADVEVSNGRVSRKFTNASGTVKPRMRGKSFTVKVAGKNPVYSLTAEAEELNGI